MMQESNSENGRQTVPFRRNSTEGNTVRSWRMKELEECLEALLAEVKPIEKTDVGRLRMPVGPDPR